MMLLKQTTPTLYQGQDAYSSGYSSPSSDDHLMSTKERVSESDYSDAEPETRSLHDEEEEEEYTSYSKAGANVRMTKKRPAPPTAATSKPKSAGNSKKKNKVCEFCGTNDTPMWRRGPQGKGTLCNACGVKWSLKYRKREKNGKEQVTSTMQSKPMKKTFKKEKSPGIDSQSQEEEEQREVKRSRRAFDSNDENSLDDSISSGDDHVERAGNRLFGSLLNVVENKLVEAQELDALKVELDNFKVATHIKSEQHARYAEQTQAKLMGEMQEFRRQFTAVLAANEAAVHNKLERVEYETREVTRKTENITRELEELKSLLKLELVGAFAAKIEGIEYQVSEMRSKMENKCQELRDQVHKEIFSLKGNLLSDYHYSERKMLRDIDNLKKLSHHELDSVQKQTNRMDYLFEINNQ